MIRVVARKYSIKGESRRAAFISFTEPVGTADLSECGRRLKRLLMEEIDAHVFVFRPEEPRILNAAAIKLMLTFNGSGPKCTGILINSRSAKLLAPSGLDDLFIIGHDKDSLLMEMEKRIKG